MTELHWLPTIPDWRPRLRAPGPADPATAWDRRRRAGQRAAELRADQRAGRDGAPRAARRPGGLATKPVRLAVLGSATLTHLLPAIRVAGLRRGIWIDTYENDFGQYLQELSDPELGAARVQADRGAAVRWTRYHLTAGVTAGHGRRRRRRRAGRDHRTGSAKPGGWRARRSAARSSSRPRCRCTCRCWATTNTGCPARAPAFLARLNDGAARPWPRRTASICSRSTTAPRATASRAWHDPALWHRSKQEVAPPAAPLYGDLVGPLARRQAGPVVQVPGARPRQHDVGRRHRRRRAWRASRSARAVALGEAYVAFQDYARELQPARRDPGGVLQERRGQRAGAVREASGDGAAARPTSPASSPTGRTRPATSARSPRN